MDVTIWLALLLIVLYLWYRYLIRNFDYFEKMGVPYIPAKPIVGSLWGMWRKKQWIYDLELMAKFGKVWGFFESSTPVISFADPAIVKQIMVADFDHFVNRRPFKVSNKYMRKMLTVVEDREWKDMRTAVTPAFSTGKMKRMSESMYDCSKTLVNYINEIVAETGGDKVDVKQVYGTYSMDIIATCAFGTKIESVRNKDDPFLEHAKMFIATKQNSNISILIPFIWPGLIGLFLSQMEKPNQFFADTVLKILETRKQETEPRQDFLGQMLETVAEEEKKAQSTGEAPSVDLEGLIAQAIIFFVAGYETTANTLTWTTMLLAQHPDIQENVYREITGAYKKYGKFTHEAIMDMPYLEMVINESLRLYPAAIRIERLCTKDVTYDGVTVRAGQLVSIPAYALQNSEEFYPNPEVFDPERFSPERKKDINPYTYLPFGTGPRNCIGMRLALEEVKIALATVFMDFTVKTRPENKDGYKSDIGGLVLAPNELYLNFELRN